MQTTSPVRLVFAALALLALPVSAQPWAQLSFTVTPEGGFPFPQNFRAERMIALVDENNDGVIGSFDGDPGTPFPFGATAVPFAPTSAGSRIGNPFVISTSGAYLGGLCGHQLVYGEQVLGGVTYFFWLAFQDPNRAPPPGCVSIDAVDFGLGSYAGVPFTAPEVHHATYIGGLALQTGHGDVAFTLPTGGTQAAPGQLFGLALKPNLPGEYQQPGLMHDLVAREQLYVGVAGARIDSLLIDVPSVRESEWDGQFLYGNSNYAFGRTLSYLTSVSGPPMRSRPRDASSSLWSTGFSDAQFWNQSAAFYGTVQFPDVNGDGKTDVCGRGNAGVLCALSDGYAFGTPTLWTVSFSDAAGWGVDASMYGTLQFPDVDGDGKADVCGRASDGLWCARSTGTRFGAATRWSTAFTNATGWNSSPSYWKTIQFADLDHDGDDDVCGRGVTGVICARSTGAAFGAATIWQAVFSDANGWSGAAYFETLQLGDVTGDGKADLCGRGFAGVYCAASTGAAFGTAFLWTGQFSDAAGWGASPVYYGTLRLGDVNGDGLMDLCGRGRGGLYCGYSNGAGFVGAMTLLLPNFRDDEGFNTERYARSFMLADVNSDGRADACISNWAGITCATSRPVVSCPAGACWPQPTLALRAPYQHSTDFGNASNWGSSPSYWTTVQPAKPTGAPAGRFCGRGGAGIICSNR